MSDVKVDTCFQTVQPVPWVPSVCFHSVSCSVGYSNSVVHLEIRCVTPLVCYSCARVLWIFKFFKWQLYTRDYSSQFCEKYHWSFDKGFTILTYCFNKYGHHFNNVNAFKSLNTIFPLVFFFIIHKSFSVSPCIIYRLD